MIDATIDPLEGRPALGPFLRMLRRRIPASSRTIGPVSRLPARCGRRVTQEEVAEAVGVSRNWYRRLETDGAVHASAKLLVRLAGALVLTSHERGTLYVLAAPEMWADEIGLRAARTLTHPTPDGILAI